MDNERDARDLQNPYAYIDSADDEAQPYHVRSDVMPWEKSPNVLHQRASHIDGAGDNSTPPPEARFDDALSFSASGNPYANIDCDDDEAQPYYLSGEAKPWERSEQLNTKNFGNPYRNIDSSSNEAQPYSSAGETPPWEKASNGKRSSLANRAWARPFIAEQTSRRSASVSKRYTGGATCDQRLSQRTSCSSGSRSDHCLIACFFSFSEGRPRSHESRRRSVPS